MVRVGPDEFYVLEDNCRTPSGVSYMLENREATMRLFPDLIRRHRIRPVSHYPEELVGPHATKAERAAFAEKSKTTPDRYIARPTRSLSTCPTFVDNGIAPRHVDLRPFVLSGRDTKIVPGGLTRVAPREGSLVVNSSQGGGTKDTWALDR
jgi:uncharacterized circularly permuted ATP-grasp superfamily protein